MTITRVGTNKKYAEGWEAAFGAGKSKKTPTKTVATKKSMAKKSAPKKKPAKS